MGNHYHLLTETPEGNLSRGMKQLHGVYTQLFNRRHKRVGHLFQGRYKALVVDKDAYLLSLCRYVVLNPVRMGLVQRPEQWPWSSYRATIGRGKGGSFLETKWVFSQFGGERRESIRRYRAFVSEGIDGESPWSALKGEIFLGSEGFIGKLSGLLKCKEPIKEIPRTQRYVTRPSLRELFKEEMARDKGLRDEAVYKAYVHHGYTLIEIAEYLGAHYATVSRALKRIEREP
jgi:putative transposase